MSVQTLDLGNVIGPQGPSGIATTSGTPSPSVGSDGDVMIDPATGVFYKNVSGTWTKICTVLLAPLDTEIDDESTNGVTNAAIAAALGEKLPIDPVVTEISFSSGEVGTYAGAHRTVNFGKIGFLALSSENHDESVWKMTINVGSSASATEIMTLPTALAPEKASSFFGALLIENSPYTYRAIFRVNSRYDRYQPCGVNIDAVLDNDFNRIRDGSNNVVSQFTATGFSLLAQYYTA